MADYQALYRKWRPQSFDDVVGQAHITETLKRQIAAGRMSHAYLFVGTRGTGKTTCAKILAKAANCTDPQNGNPCNRCPSCRGIDSGAILDVEELDAASNNGVENIRALRDEAVFTPASVRKRVYIVDEVHMLSTAAFNALLKILEEPPEHLIFILATTELHKVPATILSRCQRFSFKRITPADIAGRLSYVAEQEGLELEEDAARMLARLADGSMRDGLSLLDQCSSGGRIDTAKVLSDIGLAGSEETVKLFGLIYRNDAAGALELLDRLYFAGKGVDTVLGELASLCRDALILKVAPKSGEALISGAFPPDTLKKMASRVDSAYLEWFVTEARSAAEQAKAGGGRTAAELCLIRLSSPELSQSPAALCARIKRLEDAVSGIPTPLAQPEKAPAPEPVHETLSAQPEPVRMAEPPKPAETKSVETKPAEMPVIKSVQTNAEADEIIEACRKTLDSMQYMVLSGAENASAVLSGDTLTLYAKNAFAMGFLNKPEVLGAVREAAASVTGRGIAVKITDKLPESKPTVDKLDSLARFGNVKFE